jgi:hypothetical protein
MHRGLLLFRWCMHHRPLRVPFHPCGRALLGKAGASARPTKAPTPVSAATAGRTLASAPHVASASQCPPSESKEPDGSRRSVASISQCKITAPYVQSPENIHQYGFLYMHCRV